MSREVAKVEGYKGLQVWQRSMDLTKDVYKATKGFPADERYGLTSQIRRAAISTPSNIAEGYGRQATGEYRHHLCIARASLLELETQLILSSDLGYLSSKVTGVLTDEIQEISRMLATMTSRLKR